MTYHRQPRAAGGSTSPDARRRSMQRGQATTEFAVLALVLVPLFIAVPLVGKYIDVMQTAEAASRYLAFEAAARNTSSSWKPDADLAAEVRRRFFSNSDAPVKTGDVAGNFAAHRNPVWSDHTGHPLIEAFEDDVGAAGAPAGLNAIAAAQFSASLGLSSDNLYTGNVTVKLADVANFEPFDTIGLSTSRKTVLLADAWTARSSDMVRSKIVGGSPFMYPTALLGRFVDVIGTLPTLVFDPQLKVNAFDWDVVPCDRLVGGC
jgi:nitrate reductase NapE component